MNSARWWGVLTAVLLLWGASAWWFDTTNKKLAAEAAEKESLTNRYKQLRARFSPAAQKAARKRLVEYVRRRGAEVKTRQQGGVWHLEAVLGPEAAEGLLNRLFAAGPVPDKIEVEKVGERVRVYLEVRP